MDSSCTASLVLILARPPLQRIAVSNPRNRFLSNYLLGIVCIAVGAGLSSATDSLLPLAMGGSVGVMCTWSLVRAIWQGKLKATKRR